MARRRISRKRKAKKPVCIKQCPAVRAVFNTIELVECILAHIEVTDVARLQRVNRKINHIVNGSTRIRRVKNLYVSTEERLYGELATNNEFAGRHFIDDRGDRAVPPIVKLHPALAPAVSQSRYGEMSPSAAL